MSKYFHPYRIVLILLVCNSNIFLSSQNVISIKEICSETDCADGIDNDGDGFIDCLDNECFDIEPCDCSDGINKNNWDLESDPEVMCGGYDEEVTISIVGLDPVPATERRVIWSTGEMDVYEITVVPSELDNPYVEVTIREEDQCVETKRLNLFVSEITFDLTTTWDMRDSLWCDNWMDSTVLSISNISSGSEHEILWSTGESTLDITVFPNQELVNNGDSLIISVVVTDVDGGCGKREFLFVKTDCPCPGDPIVRPVIAATWRYSMVYDTTRALFGCNRARAVGNTCPSNCPIGTNTKPHYAVDIGSDSLLNSIVFSMYKGIVWTARPDDCAPNECNVDQNNACGEAGNTITIRSVLPMNDTIYIRYAHLNVVFFESADKGVEVKQGQALGLMGRTGNLACEPRRITHAHIVAYRDDLYATGSCTRFDPLSLFNSTYNVVSKIWTYGCN